MFDSIKELDQLLRRDKQDKQHESWMEFCHTQYYWHYEQQFFLTVFVQLLHFFKQQEVSIPVHIDTIRTLCQHTLDTHTAEILGTYRKASLQYKDIISRHLHPSEKDTLPYTKAFFKKFSHILKSKEKFAAFLEDVWIPFIDVYYAGHIKNRLRTKNWSNRFIFMQCEKYRLIEFFYKAFNPAMNQHSCPHKLTYMFYKSRNKMSYVYKSYRQNPIMRSLEELFLGNRAMRSVSYIMIILGFMFMTVFFSHAFSELSAMLLK